MDQSEDVDNQRFVRGRRGKPRPPVGSGARLARIRQRFGSRGADTTYSDLAREMEVNRDRPWSWEVQGCWPGGARLARYLARLERVRAERADPVELAKWAEFGPDDKPPFDDEAPPPAGPGDELERAAERAAEITRFEDLVGRVDRLGRLAQARALEAATDGERIPEPFRELVACAIAAREVVTSWKSPQARPQKTSGPETTVAWEPAAAA
jgi:hypothetical protein